MLNSERYGHVPGVGAGAEVTCSSKLDVQSMEKTEQEPGRLWSIQNQINVKSL